jgi:hypothetical protein
MLPFARACETFLSSKAMARAGFDSVFDTAEKCPGYRPPADAGTGH